MTNECETIKEWVGNNFMFNLPDAIYNLDACLRSRLHITFKGISGIYIIRNLITDKVYIGSTKNIMKRISEHLHMLEQGTHHSTKLQNSTNKYLYKNFEVRIYPCNVDRDFLYDVEEYLIQEYDSYTNGYNMSEDSRCKNYWTEEERREIGDRLRKCNLGKRCSEEHKRKVGEIKSIQNSGEGNPNKKLSREDVLFIRSNSTKYTCEEFCTMFNMTKTPIRNIIHLRSWKYEDCIPEGYVPPKSMKR